MSRLSLVLAASAAAAAATGASSSTLVQVDWATQVRPLQTVVAHQTVVNPLTTRDSPIHDAVYGAISHLGNDYQRFVPWLPYPRLGIAALEPPAPALCGFVESGGRGNVWSTTLDCGSRGVGTIASVQFASYGSPTGYCGSLVASPTCSSDVSAIVAAACVGKPSCTITSSDEVLGPSPCAGSRLAVQVTCSATPANYKFLSWDFGQLDPGMLDWFAAANCSSRSCIPNFSTIPAWLFQRNGQRAVAPDDPLGETWDYESGGDTFVDSTLTALGDYYGRLVAHYVEGGFIDENGAWVPGYNLTFSHWEVLNEIEGEHHMSPQTYTQVYVAIVAGIKRHAPVGSANMKFVGLALENSGGDDYMQYFLNASNRGGTPVDMVSFHHYASGARDGGANLSAYESFFTQGDAWLEQVSAIMATRDQLAPGVLLDADEGEGARRLRR